MSAFERMGHQVVYDDHYFDSLTEARWAMYFDAVGMPYVREPETFEFPAENIDIGGVDYTTRRTLYTPDFFLPEQDVYIEIKRGNANDGTASKLGVLAMRSGMPGMLIDGRPGSFAIYVFSPEPLEHEKRHYSAYDEFSCDYFFNHHQLLLSNDINAKQRERLIKISHEIFNHTFHQPTQEQIDTDHKRHRLLINNPTPLPKRRAYND